LRKNPIHVRDKKAKWQVQLLNVNQISRSKGRISGIKNSKTPYMMSYRRHTRFRHKKLKVKE
jgi:hypothetical protein